MNLLRTLPLILVALPLGAQDIAPKDSERDPILTELLEKETDVSEDEPLLVTGNPPADAHTIDGSEAPAETPQPEETEIAESPATEEPAEAGSTPPAEEPAGDDDATSADPTLAAAPAQAPESKGIRIEVQGGQPNARIAADDIDIVAPFPAKPLTNPPAGWRLAHPDGVPAFSQEVTLNNGTSVKLNIRPHVLVPDADGNEIFALREPGFDSSKGYAQTDTVGAILAESIHALDDHTDRLAAASQRLSELLDSLPAAPPVAAPVPDTSPTENPETESPQP